MIPHLNCPAIVAQDTVAANLETVQLDPYYFGYEVGHRRASTADIHESACSLYVVFFSAWA